MPVQKKSGNLLNAPRIIANQNNKLLLGSLFLLRFGQVQNCPNQLGLDLICPNDLPKLAQTCIHLPKVTKTLPKHRKSVPELSISLSS